eukprot:1147666-Pelagomonas_calceolata.AAC.13
MLWPTHKSATPQECQPSHPIVPHQECHTGAMLTCSRLKNSGDPKSSRSPCGTLGVNPSNAFLPACKWRGCSAKGAPLAATGRGHVSCPRLIAAPDIGCNASGCDKETSQDIALDWFHHKPFIKLSVDAKVYVHEYVWGHHHPKRRVS